MPERAVKPSLNGGEVQPELYGRVDLLKFQTGAKLLENFMPLLTGGVMKSPGLHYATTAEGAGCRLIRFEVANDDSLVILAGDENFTFVRFGAPITFLAGHSPLSGSQTTGSEGETVELTTPYAIEDLPTLKWAQSNDVVYFFHPDYPIYKLERLGLYDWAINAVTFEPPIDAPENLVATKTEGTTAVYQTTWYYKVAALDVDGNESFPSPSDNEAVDLDAGRDNYVDLAWDAVTGADRYVIYKGKGDLLYGFIGYAGTNAYRDDNYEPNLIDTPLVSETFFDATGDYPSCGTFAQQRLVVAGSDNDKQAVWISQPASFEDFSRSIPAKDDDGIQFTLSSQYGQTINHLVPFRYALAFTETAEWMFRTIQDDILSAATIDPVPVSWYGSDPLLPPIAIGDRCLFVQAMSGHVLDLEVNTRDTRLSADNLMVLAKHIGKGRSIVSWAWAEIPYSTVIVVYDDGEAAMLVYNKEQDVWAWCRRTTDGYLRDVCVVPEIAGDVAYFIVERVVNGTTKYFVEWQDWGMWEEVEDAIFLDSCLSYDVPVAITAFAIGDDDETLELTAAGHGCSATDTVILSQLVGITSALEPTYDVNTVWTVDSVDGDDLVLSSAQPVPEDLEDGWVSGGILRRRVTTLSGLTHLANGTVTALADGGVVEDLAVNGSGQVTLSEPAGRVTLGLGYTARLRTLSLDTANLSGQMRMRSIVFVNMQLVNSRGVLAGRVGQDELYEVEPRDFELEYHPNALLDGVYQVNVDGTWDRVAEVEIEAPYPLPCTITAITPEIDYG